jgi:uncharacterized protein YabE (DUF348 family)
MRKKHVVYVVSTGIVLILAIWGLTRQKTISLQLEGQTVQIQTTALRVRGALRSAGIELQEEDMVTPGANSLIKDGDVIELAQAVDVTIYMEGQIFHLTTTQRTPGEWLTAAGLAINENDRMVINGQNYSPDQMMVFMPAYTLEVKKAVQLTLLTEDSQWQIQSAAPTIGEALWEAGFILTEADALTPPPETLLTGPVTVRLAPGKLIAVDVDGVTLEVYTSAQTVGEALAQSGLALQGMDYSIPAADQPIPANGTIRVVRVTEEVVINQETIPYGSSLQPDPELEIDQFRVIQAGQVGLRAERVRIRFEDGEEVSRQVEDEWVSREPVERIQGYGTKIVIRTMETPDGIVEYWRAVEMYATSYSPCGSAGEPGKCYPVTSSGLPVERGVVAVILDWYLQMGGQGVYIPGYGHATIEDVGGGIPGRYWIDLGFTDENYESWHQYVIVYFTTPVPPVDEIVYILISN